MLLGPSLGRSRFVYISFLSHLHHHLPSSSSSLPKNNSTDSNIKLQRPLRSLPLSSATESSPAAHVNSEGIKRSVEKLVSSHSPVRVSGAFSKEVGEGKEEKGSTNSLISQEARLGGAPNNQLIERVAVFFSPTAASFFFLLFDVGREREEGRGARPCLSNVLSLGREGRARDVSFGCFGSLDRERSQKPN